MLKVNVGTIGQFTPRKITITIILKTFSCYQNTCRTQKQLYNVIEHW